MTTAAQQGADGGEWRSYAGDTGGTKYSPLAQITPENVGDLAVAWRWESADGQFDLDELRAQYPALQIGNDTTNVSISGLKGTPLMVGDTLYLSTALSQVAAIDAATGETRWVHDPKSYAAGIPTMVVGFSSRGLAYWTDGQTARIIWATGDARLHAVDAATGEPVPEFGDDGSVDLMRGIRRARRDPPPINYSVTSPPVVCNDVVIVGSAVSDQPRFKESPTGYVRGFNARTGELRWTFHTIPLAGEVGHDTWRDGSASYTGNANVWTMMTADADLGYAYLPVGNATNDHYGGHRPGSNLFANSLVCVECATGKRVWHFQLVHHDLWDYDPPAAPNLVDITVDGQPIKAVAQVTKQAFTFVFDRVTGEPVWPIEERAVPSSDVPGEWTSPTPAVPDEAAAVRPPGGHRGGPDRLHAGAARRRSRDPARLRTRADVHAAVPSSAPVLATPGAPSSFPATPAVRTGTARRSTPRPVCSMCPRRPSRSSRRWSSWVPIVPICGTPAGGCSRQVGRTGSRSSRGRMGELRQSTLPVARSRGSAPMASARRRSGTTSGSVASISRCWAAAAISCC